MGLEAFFSNEYLKEFYLRYIKTKPNTIGIDKVGKKSFENKIFEYTEMISRKVLEGNYKISKYRGVLIPKRPDKLPRCLAISTIKDRIVLGIFKDILQEYYYKSAKQELIQSKIDKIKSAVKENNFNAYIKIDIIDFFPSISHDSLLNKLMNDGIDQRLYTIIHRAIRNEIIFNDYVEEKYKTENKGIPQGLPISNILAEIYMNEFDNKYLEKSDISYFRYVDDILILCNEEQIDTLIKDIRSDVETLKLCIHGFDTGKSKIGRIADGFIYLGYKYDGHIFSVKNDSVLRLERTIESIFSKHKKRDFSNIELLIWELNSRITGVIVETRNVDELGQYIKKKYGWIFFYSQIDDVPLLHHLDYLVKKLIYRYKLENRIDLSLVKRFVKSYNHIKYKRHETDYIPNYSKYTIDDKKELLEKIFKRDISKKSDEEIENQFEYIVYQTIKDLEEDVQFFS